MKETQKTWVGSLGWEAPLKEELATHSSILAWRIPWTDEPGGLPSRSHSHTTELDMTEHEQRRALICDTDFAPGNLCRGWVSPAMPSDRSGSQNPGPHPR